MRIARTTVATLLAASLLVLGACGDDDDVTAGDSPDTTAPSSSEVTVPAAPADHTGTVTSLSPFEPITEDCTPPEDVVPDSSVSNDDPPVCTPADNEIVGTVLVEEQPGVQEGNKISFTVMTSTALLDGDGAPITFSDLAEGQSVEGWSSGFCAESYPSQCEAVAIRATG